MRKTGARLLFLTVVTIGAVLGLMLWAPPETSAGEAPLGIEDFPVEPAGGEVSLPGGGAGSGRIVEGGEGLMDLLWKGGGVMLFILICSVVGLAFAVERAIALRRSAHIEDDLARNALEAFRRGGPGEVRTMLGGKSVSQAKLLTAAVARLHQGYQEMEFAIAEAGARLLYQLQRNVRILGILANVAPLLGLLGTVLGMIEAFSRVAKVGALGKTTELAGGISKALLTTGFGLLVAIPAYLLYHYFKGRAEGLVREMEETAGNFALELEAAPAGASGGEAGGGDE